MKAVTIANRDLDAVRLCRVVDAANMLAVSRSTIYKLMESGELGYVKIGRARRIAVAAVLDLVEENRVRAPAGRPSCPEGK